MDAEQDPLYDQACEIVVRTRRPSITLLQRHLGIGYTRAARLIEDMERSGVISPMQSDGNHEVLVSPREDSEPSDFIDDASSYSASWAGKGIQYAHYIIFTLPLVAGAIAALYLMDGVLNLKTFALWVIISAIVAVAMGFGWGVIFGPTRDSITVTSLRLPSILGARTQYIVETQMGTKGSPTRFDEPMEKVMIFGTLLFLIGVALGAYVFYHHCPGGWGC